MSELTTLCYVEREDAYLMLHRIKKKKDVNKDKWIGIGGHFEQGESPEECLLREAKEETGLTLTSWQLRGVVTFCFYPEERGEAAKDMDILPPVCEYMWLYTADGFEGTLSDCNEGTLEWIPKKRLDELNMWEGDRIFFRLLEQKAPFFSLKLEYQGDRLERAALDGREMELPDWTLDLKG